MSVAVPTVRSPLFRRLAPSILALSLAALAPMTAQAAAAPAGVAHAAKAKAAAQAQADEPIENEDDVPASAPKDDYRFVGWCYGVLDEYLRIYEIVKPDLKDIDKLFGTPVVEAEPYASDIAEDRKALKRFASAIEAAEKASAKPIAPEGAAAIQSGRKMWAAARLEPHRRMADAWLFWGLPARCDRVAKSLKTRATLMGQAFAVDAPVVEPPAPAHVLPVKAPAPTAPPKPAPSPDEPISTAGAPRQGDH
ncbi:MAG: hypothetical protein P4L64_00595 [Caulobacteraceae bacterium]|nr:hypothetical protein [Caulobacteraceae bacterium]